MIRFFFIFFLFPVVTKAQVTIILQPNASSGKDALLANCVPCGYLNTNYGSSVDFASAGWTNSSAESDLRALIEFNLSSIPVQSTIVNARLSLYHNPNSQNGTHSSLTASNEGTIKRVITPWSENTVTWNTQPSTTSLNEVYVPQSASSNQDYTNINVTILVQNMIDNLSNSHGFLFRALNESPYNRLIFASSDHPNEKLHPRLEITYEAAVIVRDSCQIIRPGSELGKDAIIESRLNNSNFGNHPDLFSVSWTNGGIPVDGRGLVEFDLSGVPQNATLLTAELSLFGQNSPFNGSHSSLSGSNESVIKRVTAPWSENTVTWNNQPGTTSLNQVILPQNTVANQSFIDIDVLGMTQNMIGLNNSNNGFLIKLSNESYYRRMIFASSDHSDVQKHPKLRVCYSYTTHLIESETEIGFNMYPNPSSTSVKIVADLSEEYNLNVFDVRGRLILNSTLNSSSTLDVSDFSKGLYIVQLSNGEKVSSKKLIIQ